MPQDDPHSNTSEPATRTPDEDLSSKVRQPLQRVSRITRVAPVVALTATVALLICLIGHFSTLIVNFDRTKSVIEASKDVLEMLAVAAGGVWAYFKFVKGRTFKESLSPAVSGKFVSIDGVNYLIAATQIKNVGLSKIEFNREGSALILFEYSPSFQDEIHTVAENRLTSFEIFGDKDRYIEPNEIIVGQRFIALPNSLKLAYRLEVEVVSKAGFTWQASHIVDKSLLSDNGTRDLIGL